jgi:hypothetical protein
VLCTIFVPLPPGKNPFTFEINNDNNDNNNNNNNKFSSLNYTEIPYLIMSRLIYTKLLTTMVIMDSILQS